MNELDKKIQEALRKEDAELAEEFGGEPSIFEMLMETFRGRHRWLVFLTMFWTIVTLAILATAVLCGNVAQADYPGAIVSDNPVAFYSSSTSARFDHRATATRRCPTPWSVPAG